MAGASGSLLHDTLQALGEDAEKVTMTFGSDDFKFKLLSMLDSEEEAAELLRLLNIIVLKHTFNRVSIGFEEGEIYKKDGKKSKPLNTSSISDQDCYDIAGEVYCEVVKRLNGFIQNITEKEYNEKARQAWLRAYLGDDDYPQIVDKKTFDAVQSLTEKNVHRIPEEEQAHAEIFKEKTRCSICGGVIARRSMVKGQKDRVQMRCTNKECECSQTTITLVQLEEYIKKLFGMIANDLGMIDNEIQKQDELKGNENITSLTGTLRMNMHNPCKTADDIMKEITDVASARFDECTTSLNEKVTERLKEQIHGSASEIRIEANSIDEVIQRIILAPDKTVTIRFKNGKEFSERMA